MKTSASRTTGSVSDFLQDFGDILWRPAVIEYPERSDEVIVGGYCVLQSGRRREALALASNGTVVRPNFIDNEKLRATLWFLKGDCFHLHRPFPISHSRTVFQLFDSDTGERLEPYKFAVVPARQDFEGIPVPEKNRMRRVAGNADTPVKFLDGGCATTLQMDALLQTTTGAGLNSFRSVLDWGIGCGRVARFMTEFLAPGTQLTGADIDEFNLAWCRDNLPNTRTLLFPLMPPTQANTHNFDLIYGMSVLTHLTEEAQRAWLAELARILVPGGIAYLTFNGATSALYQGRDSSVVKSLRTRGISDERSDPALGQEMTEYYRATYQTTQHVTSVAGAYFAVLGHYPHMFGAQDVLILRRS